MKQMERQSVYKDRVKGEAESRERERTREREAFVSNKGILLPHQRPESKTGCFSSSLTTKQDRNIPVIRRPPKRTSKHRFAVWLGDYLVSAAMT